MLAQLFFLASSAALVITLVSVRRATRRLAYKSELVKTGAIRFVVGCGAPFWCGNLIEQNPAKPCWSHTIGLPRKNGIECPIWDFQLSLVQTYLDKRFVMCKKARALGISYIKTIALRIRVWWWFAARGKKQQ